MFEPASSVPVDDYTPHGYLDIPEHTRNLTPKGVLRSHGVGFRWHVPAFAASYGGRRETYRAGLRLSLGGTLEPRVRCTYHSKNLFRFEIESNGTQAIAEYHTVGPDALRALVNLEQAQPGVRLGAHLEYTRLVSANGEWGESGLVGRLEDGLLVLQSFEDGEAFVLWASQPFSDAGVSADEAEAASWASSSALPPEGGFVNALGKRGETVRLFGAMGFQPRRPEQEHRSAREDQSASSTVSSHTLELILARGKTLVQARANLERAWREAEPERARKLAADDAFWSRAPKLEGDWPSHWRRGFVYDLETLRMMVKAPVGVYRHAWDAMQIQAPRVVLAEAAMDALALGYADPEAAQSMLLGILEDASEPNVPCSREDGTFNMVAADGTVCGTGPQWGYPFLAAATLYAMRPKRAWLERVYARLEAYLHWWLAHRADAEGWLHFACSWESGQDDSPRFGEQPLGGGHPVRHVRPVDLHASVAHGARVLADFAAMLGRPHESENWRELQRRFLERTDALWNGVRYADLDTRSGAFVDVNDPMLLAPYALGCAGDDRREAGLAHLAQQATQDHAWPMFYWTALEAAQHLGALEVASSLAHGVADRAYGFWDARDHDPQKTLPGIACEYWPAHGRCGGEGYGWGAFNVHLVLRHLVGYAPTPSGLRLRPNLPDAWRMAGRTHAVRLHHHGRPLEIRLETLEGDRLEVGLNAHRVGLRWGETLERTDGELFS